MKANWLVCILFLAVRLPAQTITTQPTNQVVIGGGNVTFNVVVSGTGPFTYQWQFNGTNLPPAGIITTVAGNGSAPFSGDGGVATNAEIQPTGVAVDAAGNLFIADDDNNRIRKVDTNGIITTVAGNGNASFSGDGGVATNAALQNPFGVTVDAAGNLFIADTVNWRIRKVNTNGIITTVAGNGTNFFSGDGGAATNAGMHPASVALDAVGNLFIADNGNYRIRKVNTNGIITTVAGNGNQSFSGDGGAATNAALNAPISVAVDSNGNLFIADANNNRVRKVDTNGIITTVAGNGTLDYSGAGDGGVATNAGVASPYGVVVDVLGNLFIADANDSRIRKVNTNGIITTVAGSANTGFSGDGGAATRAWLANPFGVTVDTSGDLFIADNSNFRIREVQYNSNPPALILNNVSTNDAGNYSVVITGSGGSVTSSVVTLKVVIMPFIINQPQPLTVTSGHAASFVVTADGLPSLAYQWQFNGTNLPSASDTNLTLQNAFPTNTGIYSVVITNAYGSVTSNPAMLTVLPLNVTAPTMLTSGYFQFNFDTATGVDYTVEYSTNLAQWFPLLILGGNGVPMTVIDPNTAGSPQRYYRIILSAQ